MNDMSINGSCNVETYDYRSDFKFLTSKEKREILKNAKYLLKLQKENNAFFADTTISQNESKKKLA